MEEVKNLKKESIIIAAQDQTLRTRHMRNVLYGENLRSICHVCGTAGIAQLHALFQNAQN